MPMTTPLNHYIEHMILDPGCTVGDVEKALDAALRYGFSGITVPPHMASAVVLAVKAEPLRVGTVISFPYGNLPLQLKVQQADFFINNGIDDLDFSINLSELNSNNFPYLIKELRVLGDMCKQRGVVSKAIINAVPLTEQQKVAVCEYVKSFGNVDYIVCAPDVKDVTLFKELRAFGRPLIKASGDIETLSQALALIEAGADRLGTGGSVKLMEEFLGAEKGTDTDREEEVPTTY